METIEIKKKNLPIDKGFKLEGMKKMNIIVGKNSVGKTKFFESIEKEYGDIFDITFIKAKDINPSENQFKSTASTSDLIKNVSKLFNNLNIKPNLNIKDIKPKLRSLVEKTNSNFKEFTSNEDISISNNIADNIKIETVIQSLLDKFEVNEKGIEKPLKPEDIGQGYQRMLVASILKSYTDLVSEIGTKDPEKTDKEVLILFEEPEAFLPPQLKRVLNKVLKDISEIANYTVVISTHDPYFLWSNLNDEDIQIYSFVKENGLTVAKKDGASFEIEDEMLHINLFNKLILEMNKKGKNISLGKDMEKTSFDMINILNDEKLEITKQYTYKYKKDKKEYTEIKIVLLPIYVRNIIHHHPVDKITNEEIEQSVNILNVLLKNI